MNELQSLVDSIKSLTELDDSIFNDDAMVAILDNVDGQFSSAVVEQSINQMIKNFEDQGLTKAEAAESIKALSDTIKDMVYGENQFTGNKRYLLIT